LSSRRKPLQGDVIIIYMTYILTLLVPFEGKFPKLCIHLLPGCPFHLSSHFFKKKKSRVGRSALIFFLLLSAKLEIVISDSDISFSKFPVSRHLLKLFYVTRPILFFSRRP
jgi:hypothetical protein